MKKLLSILTYVFLFTSLASFFYLAFEWLFSKYNTLTNVCVLIISLICLFIVNYYERKNI